VREEYTVKKLDAGAGIVRILAADGIDNFFQTEGTSRNQFQFVRVSAKGHRYDVMGGRLMRRLLVLLIPTFALHIYGQGNSGKSTLIQSSDRTTSKL